MERNVQIIKEPDGRNVVVIYDIIFKNRRDISWDDVEVYLKRYLGEIYEIIESSDRVYIGKDFIDEFTGSNYTAKLKGTAAKAKANAAQGIPEMIEIALNKRYKENLARKHGVNAKYGWYRYDTRFALPVVDENEDIIRYNVFQAELLIRHDANGKLYLYDVINIKKKRSTPHEPKLDG